MPYVFNPYSNKHDNNGYSLSTLDARYLLLNQSTPQTVINGAPIFDAGLKANDDIIILAGKKLVLDGA